MFFRQYDSSEKSNNDVNLTSSCDKNKNRKGFEDIDRTELEGIKVFSDSKSKINKDEAHITKQQKGPNKRPDLLSNLKKVS